MARWLSRRINCLDLWKIGQGTRRRIAFRQERLHHFMRTVAWQLIQKRGVAWHRVLRNPPAAGLAQSGKGKLLPARRHQVRLHRLAHFRVWDALDRYLDDLGEARKGVLDLAA